MPIAMSYSIVAPDELSLNLTPTGFSQESEELKKSLQDAFDKSYADIGKVGIKHEAGIAKSISRDIEEIKEECSDDNWDGYGAKPISDDACKALLGFISQVPASLPVPEVVPESDGDVGLEWHVNNDRWLIMSFNGRGEVHYAARFDEYTKNDGVSRLDHEQTRFLIGLVRMILA